MYESEGAVSDEMKILQSQYGSKQLDLLTSRDAICINSMIIAIN